MLPKALLELISAISSLPGVGARTSERYAYFLYQNDTGAGEKLADAIKKVKTDVKVCPKTFAFIDKDEKVSKLYSSEARDKKIIAIVADPFDVIAIEKTSSYRGTYHVLGGLISPIDGISPEALNLTSLKKRVKEDKVREVIIATNASVEGETTAHYISKMFFGEKVKITRIAQGLPIGLDIGYADQITLSKALEGRRKI
ncbi:MAG TPA: recombination mediator RecR [Candidatus Saccharimonadales bacterium]|nr:recombination mediator RecR [Candidatus Saccharimonadales bacterium]